YPSREPALALVVELPVLEVTPAIAEIVAAYVRHRLMPEDPAGDALHLALASYHKCEFLVTWNCQPLANANKFGHLRSRQRPARPLRAGARHAPGAPWR